MRGAVGASMDWKSMKLKFHRLEANDTKEPMTPGVFIVFSLCFYLFMHLPVAVRGDFDQVAISIAKSFAVLHSGTGVKIDLFEEISGYIRIPRIIG